MASLFLIIGYGEKKSNPVILHLGRDGAKARVVLEKAGEDKKTFEAQLIVNPQFSKRRIFTDNASEETKAANAAARSESEQATAKTEARRLERLDTKTTTKK